MNILSDDIIHFFKNQGFVIVTSIDGRGMEAYRQEVEKIINDK
jgi:sulfatase maturation enzyme AslB (radical SAM superfamily)